MLASSAQVSEKEVTHWKIKPDDLVTIAGREWTLSSEWSDGVVLKTFNNDRAPYTKAFGWREISNLFNARRLTVDRGHFSERAAIERALTSKQFELDPEKVLRVMMVARFIQQEGTDDEWNDERSHRSDEDIERFYAIFKSENKELIEKARASIDAKGKKKLFVGPRQFRRLINRFEEDGMSPASLADRYPGGGTPGSTLEARDLENLMKFVATARTPERPTVKSAWIAMQDANQELLNKELPGYRQVSLTTFQRAFSEGSDFLNDIGRNEETHATQRKYFTKAKGLQPKRPLEIIEMDETPVHLMTMFIKNRVWDWLHTDAQVRIEALGRVWLSVALDAYSRSVCGLKILRDAPDADAAVATLAMVAQQKDKLSTLIGATSKWPQCGTPSAVHTDAGSGYVSAKFELAVMMFTGKLRIPPSKHPHLRGRVERFFRTINQRYIHLFSGQTFSNPLLKKDYDAAKFAHVTDEEFADLIARLIIDCYHNTVHKALGMTPLQAWYRGSQLADGAIIPPPSPRQYREIFGATIKRSIGNEGVTIMSNNYSSDELVNLRMKWHGASLLVRLNEEDLSSISVKHRRKNQWIDVPAVNEGLKGVTLAEWEETLRLIAQTWGTSVTHSPDVVREALKAAREIIQNSKTRPGVLVHRDLSVKLKEIETAYAKVKYENKPTYDYGADDAAIDEAEDDIDTELEHSMGRMKKRIIQRSEEELALTPVGHDQSTEGKKFSRENFKTEEARRSPSASKAVPTVAQGARPASRPAKPTGAATDPVVEASRPMPADEPDTGSNKPKSRKGGVKITTTPGKKNR